MGNQPRERARDILRFHGRMLKDFPRLLFDAEGKRQTIAGVVSAFVIPTLNALLRNLPDEVMSKIPIITALETWKVALFCLACFLIWAKMKVSYRLHREIETERDDLKEKNSKANADLEELFQDLKKSAGTIRKLLPYKAEHDEQVARNEKEMAAFEAFRPARDLLMKTYELLAELDTINERLEAEKRRPLAYPAGMLDPIIQDYEERLASRVLAVKGEYLDRFRMTSADLDRLCFERPRTAQTLRAIRESLDGLAFRLNEEAPWPKEPSS